MAKIRKRYNQVPHLTQDTSWESHKNTINITNKSQEVSRGSHGSNEQTRKHEKLKVRKRTKIRNRYNQAPHLTQDTNGNVTTSQLDITNESQEVRTQKQMIHKRSLGTVSKNISLEGLNQLHSNNLAPKLCWDQDTFWESDKTQQTRQPRGQPFPSR